MRTTITQHTKTYLCLTASSRRALSPLQTLFPALRPLTQGEHYVNSTKIGRRGKRTTGSVENSKKHSKYCLNDRRSDRREQLELD